MYRTYLLCLAIAPIYYDKDGIPQLEYCMSDNYYQILGIQEKAEDIVVRAAYRALAQRYHPDKSDLPKAIATQKMALIQEAYEVLSDPTKRAQYDALGRPSRSNTKSPGAGFTTPPTARPINDLDAQAWELLVHSYPQLRQNFSQIEKKNIHLANTYKNLLLEFVSEKMVSKMVQKITDQMHDYVDAENLPPKKQKAK
jgi:curved DNA-binding protein CbpA